MGAIVTDNPFQALISNALKIADKLVEFELQIQSNPFELDIDTQLSKPEGIELTDLSQLQVDEVTGVFNYHGRNVVLYIPDHSYRDNFAQVLSGNLNQGRKFHLTSCSVLENMKNNGRFERYHINQNKENLFQITNNDNQTAYTPLLVCIKCLQQLNYKNYNPSRNSQNSIRNNFNFNQFLQEYTTNFNELPEYIGQDKGGYTSDWVSISTSYRASKNYTCEQCGVNLISRKGLLHTHHKNGVKHDNNYNNLEALCIVCHSDQPFHGHIKWQVEKAKAEILALRKVQGIV